MPYLQERYFERLRYAAEQNNAETQIVPSSTKVADSQVMAPNAHALTLHEAEFHGAGVVPRFEQDVEGPLLDKTYLGRAGAVLAKAQLVHVASPAPDAWFDDASFLSEVRDALGTPDTSEDVLAVFDRKFAIFQEKVRKFLVAKSGQDVEYDLLVKKIEDYLREDGRLVNRDALFHRTNCLTAPQLDACSGRELGVHNQHCKCALMKLGAPRAMVATRDTKALAIATVSAMEWGRNLILDGGAGSSSSGDAMSDGGRLDKITSVKDTRRWLNGHRSLGLVQAEDQNQCKALDLLNFSPASERNLENKLSDAGTPVLLRGDLKKSLLARSVGGKDNAPPKPSAPEDAAKTRSKMKKGAGAEARKTEVGALAGLSQRWVRSEAAYKPLLE